jgi:hypothetical protein
VKCKHIPSTRGYVGAELAIENVAGEFAPPLLECRGRKTSFWGTPMAIRIKTDFGSLTHNNLWNRGMAVFLALSGSVKYSNPPMAMVALKSLLDAFHEAKIEAMDGGKMARTNRESLHAQVITALNHLASYVQANCDGDPSDSGFESYDTKTPRKAGQLVTPPSFRKVYQGVNSGEMMLLINAVLYARGYEVQYAALQDGNPGPWTVVDVMNVKSAFKISGLTPITNYAFQVRAIGTANRSDWSASVNMVCR